MNLRLEFVVTGIQLIGCSEVSHSVGEVASAIGHVVPAAEPSNFFLASANLSPFSLELIVHSRETCIEVLTLIISSR